MSDPLKNAGNFIEISGHEDKTLEEQVRMLRYATAELLRYAEESRVAEQADAVWRDRYGLG